MYFSDTISRDKMDISTKPIAIAILVVLIKTVSPSPLLNKPNLRVYGGDTAKPGQFPFVVSIGDRDYGHICGGTIINANWVLTAAHCLQLLDSFEYYVVLTGTTYLDQGGTKHDVVKIINHPLYNFTTYINDLALLKIRNALIFNELVQPIGFGQVTGYESVTVIGWGATEEDLYPDELHYTSLLQVLSDEDCTKLSAGGMNVHERGPGQVCTLGVTGVAPCHGDSGGPLVYKGALVGVVSYAVSPCAQGFPDVYTRVAYYVDWINRTVSDN